MISSFADILAPMTPDAFFADHFGRAPAHIEGDPAKIGDLLSWAGLNQLLSFEDHWTCETLKLYDRQSRVPDTVYRKAAKDTMPAKPYADMAKVAAHMTRGAGIVLHAGTGLTAGIQSIVLALEHELLSKVRPEIYCSFADQAIHPSHFDTHDLFVVQTAGEKVWNLYEGRLDSPIDHPAFTDQSTAFHLRARAGVLMTVTLTPGDVLYIPRGQYHDALASGGGSIHVSFASTGLRGHDVFQLFEKQAVTDRLFRQDLPLHTRPGGRDLLAARLEGLAEQILTMSKKPDVLDALIKMQERNSTSRRLFDLPNREAPKHFRLMLHGLRVARHGDIYKLEDDRQGTAIPFDAHELVAWVLRRPVFTNVEARAEFPEMPPARVEELLEQLAAMRVVAVQS